MLFLGAEIISFLGERAVHEQRNVKSSEKAVFVSTARAMPTACLEHCIWDRYQSLSLLLEIENIWFGFFYFSNVMIKKYKKEQGWEDLMCYFLLEYIAARGACPAEWPQNQPSPVQSKLSFGPDFTGNKVQILSAISEIVDLNSRYSQAILIHPEIPAQV